MSANGGPVRPGATWSDPDEREAFFLNRPPTESALHAVAHAVPFEDSSLNIAQILAMGLSSLPENDESREWMENAVGICLGTIVEAVNHQTPDPTPPTPET